MRIIDDETAIALWEGTARLAPIDRAVQILATVEGMDLDLATDLPIDQRDRILIDARCQSYGTKADFYVACPACEEALEIQFDLSLLLKSPTEESKTASQLRAPSSRMIAKAAKSGNTKILINACCDDPGKKIETLQAELEERFPLLRVEIDLDCAQCGHSFLLPFDPQDYLWEDINRHAGKLFDEVHVLASSYGWRDSEILKMSGRRRSAYLARLSS